MDANVNVLHFLKEILLLQLVWNIFYEYLKKTYKERRRL